MSGEIEPDYQPILRKRKLTEAEKELVRSGQLKSKMKRIAGANLRRDAAINEFTNRSEGQLNSPMRFGGKKLGTHRKKRRANVRSIPTSPPPRKPPKQVEDDIESPTQNVESYLAHLRSLRPNLYSKLLMNCWGDPRISEEGYRILCTLPQCPSYSLRYVNRIFSEDSWQNIPREDRQIVFGSCVGIDFRSLHFEIFMSILRRYLPEDAAKISSLLGDKHIWAWFESQGIPKQDAKTPLQMLLNCKTAKKTLLLLKEPGRQEFEKQPPEGWVPTRILPVTDCVERLVKLVNSARNRLTNLIKRNEVKDAFGNPLPRLRRLQYYQLKGELKPSYMLVRTDLNTLYSSYELKLMSELLAPVIRAYDRFKIVLHLHDGAYFQVDRKYKDQVLRKLKRDSEKLLKEMDIQSELRWD